MALSPTADLLALGGHVGLDAFLEVWDLARGEVRVLETPHFRRVEKVRFSSDGRRLASSDTVGRIAIWDASSGRLLHTYETKKDLEVIAFGSTDRRFWSAPRFRDELQCWDPVTGERVDSARPEQASAEQVFQKRISPSGRLALTLGGRDRVLTLWAIDSQKTIKSWPRARGPRFLSDEHLALVTKRELEIWTVTGDRVRVLPVGAMLASAGTYVPSTRGSRRVVRDVLSDEVIKEVESVDDGGWHRLTVDPRRRWLVGLKEGWVWTWRLGK